MHEGANDDNSTDLVKPALYFITFHLTPIKSVYTDQVLLLFFLLVNSATTHMIRLTVSCRISHKLSMDRPIHRPRAPPILDRKVNG